MRRERRKPDGRKLDGRRRILGDVLEHRPLRGDGDAEIAMQHALEEDEVALPQRQIEAPFGAPFGDEGLVRGGDVAELRQDRVAGHHIGDEEDDERGEKRHHRGHGEPRDDVARQG